MKTKKSCNTCRSFGMCGISISQTNPPYCEIWTPEYVVDLESQYGIVEAVLYKDVKKIIKETRNEIIEDLKKWLLSNQGEHSSIYNWIESQKGK